MHVLPRANIPLVAFPVPVPAKDATLAAVAEELTLHAYVYLFLVVKYVGLPDPNANIPLVEFPAAD